MTATTNSPFRCGLASYLAGKREQKKATVRARCTRGVQVPCEGCGKEAIRLYSRDQFPLCGACRKAQGWRRCWICREHLPSEELEGGACLDCAEAVRLVHASHQQRLTMEEAALEPHIRECGSVLCVEGVRVRLDGREPMLPMFDLDTEERT